MHQTVSRTRFATTSVATGVDLHYAEQGEAGAEVILFLHGWPDSWYSHRRVLELVGRRQNRGRFGRAHSR